MYPKAASFVRQRNPVEDEDGGVVRLLSRILNLSRPNFNPLFEGLPIKMSSIATVSSFVQGAPPGEVCAPPR